MANWVRVGNYPKHYRSKNNLRKLKPENRGATKNSQLQTFVTKFAKLMDGNNELN